MPESAGPGQCPAGAAVQGWTPSWVAGLPGRTENALPFRSAHMLRPGFIQPRHGIRSRTRVYRILYALLRPLVPLFRRLAPGMVLDSDQLGRAMVQVAAEGHPKAILEVADLQALGG